MAKLGDIKNEAAVDAAIKFWNSFPPKGKPPVTAIQGHLYSKGLTLPRPTLIHHLKNSTSYGKMSQARKNLLRIRWREKLIAKGQADLQKYIKDNASKFDNVKDFEKAILKHFDKPEYKVFDLEKAYSPISLQRQTPLKKAAGLSKSRNIKSLDKDSFIYETPKHGKGLRLWGFEMDDPIYKKSGVPKISSTQGSGYITQAGTRRQQVARGTQKVLQQILGIAIAENNPKVKKKLKEAIDFSNYKNKLLGTKRWKIRGDDLKLPQTTIDEVWSDLDPKQLRGVTPLNKYIKNKGMRYSWGKAFTHRDADQLADFISIYGPKKGREEFKFFNETLRMYFRDMGFQKEHTVPRQLIKLGKVPKEMTTKIRGATGLVNVVAKNYQDKIIKIIREAEKVTDGEELAKLSGQAKKIATDFKRLTGGYPLPFGIDKKGRFELLDPGPLPFRAKGSKNIGPISRLGLEFTDSLRINENITNAFNKLNQANIPEEKIFDIFGKNAMQYLGSAYNKGQVGSDKFKLNKEELRLANIFSQNPQEGYKATWELFKDDPIEFLKSTRIGQAASRAMNTGAKFGSGANTNYGKIANAVMRKGALPAVAIGVGLSLLTPGSLEAAEVTPSKVVEPQENLKYNSTLGSIVNTKTEEPADQLQVWEWLKENPVKTVAGTSIGFSAQEIPGAYKKARELGRGRTRSALGITGALKPVLTTFGTPAMTTLFEVPFAAKRLEEGETMTDVLTDPLGPALGLTFMEPLSRGAGVIRDAPKRTMAEGLRNYFNLQNVGTARPGMTSKFLRMGMSPRMIAGASRFLGLPGLALSLGLTGYDAYKNYQNQEGMIYNFFNRDE